MISLSSLRAWPAALGKLVSHLASRVSFFDWAGMDRPAGTSAAGAAGARAAASARGRPAVMMFRIVRVIGVLNHIPCPKLGHPARSGRADDSDVGPGRRFSKRQS